MKHSWRWGITLGLSALLALIGQGAASASTAPTVKSAAVSHTAARPPTAATNSYSRNGKVSVGTLAPRTAAGVSCSPVLNGPANNAGTVSFSGGATCSGPIASFEVQLLLVRNGTIVASGPILAAPFPFIAQPVTTSCVSGVYQGAMESVVNFLNGFPPSIVGDFITAPVTINC